MRHTGRERLSMPKFITITALAAGVRVGGGGPEITCDTMNGDILIKKSY